MNNTDINIIVADNDTEKCSSCGEIMEPGLRYKDDNMMSCQLCVRKFILKHMQNNNIIKN